jgi:hypothetical protein
MVSLFEQIETYGTYALLLAIWIIVLIRLRGSQFPALLVLTTALIALQIESLIAHYFGTRYDSGDSSMIIVTSAVCFGTLDFALFNVVHFEFAWIYHNIAIGVPLELNGLERNDSEIQKEERNHDLLMAANIIVVLLSGVAGLVFNISWVKCVADQQSNSCSV